MVMRLRGQSSDREVSLVRMLTNRINRDLAVARPFLRWAGGKQRLVRHLSSLVPPDSHGTYYEPFFGAGSLFFSIRPPRAVISDVNTELMNCYRQVARQPIAVARLLAVHKRRDCAKYYYWIREIEVGDLTCLERAARFIYLNKAAFNGIYRVNLAGKFNVPYGPSTNGAAIPSLESLRIAGESLRNAHILTMDFEEATRGATKGDFVYLDPPYPPRSKTAFFTHYSADRFPWEGQLRVAKAFRSLAEKGCYVMLSNSFQKEIKSLFVDFNFFRLDTMRWVGSNGDRFGVREIVVTNYVPEGYRK
jgi:DNA adenine methylase